MKLNLNKIFFRLSLKEKMLFARHMEVMTKSGMQILQSLEMLKGQTRSKAFISVLDQLIYDVKNGHFLSTGLERYREVFGDFFINLVKVGEASGTLSDNFKYLSEELKKKAEIRSKVRGAMTYPIIIFIATIGITSLLTFFIFPKILPILESINVELPLITRAFVVVSTFMISYGLYVLLGLTALIVGFVIVIRIPSVKFQWHKFLLAIPFINDMIKTVNLINLSRTLGLLLKAGLKIVEALDISADTLSNLVYKKELKEIAQAVKEGDPISKHLVMHTNLFSPIFSQMIIVGENTGKLEESLFFLSDFYEGEMDEATKAMSNFLEPVLLLAMGLVVGFVALAIITPIYKITQTLGR